MIAALKDVKVTVLDFFKIIYQRVSAGKLSLTIVLLLKCRQQETKGGHVFMLPTRQSFPLSTRCFEERDKVGDAEIEIEREIVVVASLGKRSAGPHGRDLIRPMGATSMRERRHRQRSRSFYFSPSKHILYQICHAEDGVERRMQREGFISSPNWTVCRA